MRQNSFPVLNRSIRLEENTFLYYNIFEINYYASSTSKKKGGDIDSSEFFKTVDKVKLIHRVQIVEFERHDVNHETQCTGVINDF